jgi:ribosomal protein S18 acetylase RimI-like enzyme
MIVREAIEADAAGIAKVHVDTWRSTYRGIVSDDVLDGLSYNDRESMWRLALTTRRSDNHLYVVESADGEVIGFAAAGLEREEQTGKVGEIFAIYLLKRYQGKGLGKRLFTETARRLEREGYQSILLWVLAENPARRFYEAMGGTATKRKDIEIGQDTLVEVAYEWERLQDLTR